MTRARWPRAGRVAILQELYHEGHGAYAASLDFGSTGFAPPTGLELALLAADGGGWIGQTRQGDTVCMMT